MNKKWDFPVRRTNKPPKLQSCSRAVNDIHKYMRKLEAEKATPEERRALLKLVRGGK
jgi:hypothetical protein